VTRLAPLSPAIFSSDVRLSIIFFYPSSYHLQKRRLGIFASQFNKPNIYQSEMASGNVSNGHTYGSEDSIPHKMEKDLPGGENWVAQKFGGTSVGKFPLNIADIVE
jgi:hypothetical protein